MGKETHEVRNGISTPLDDPHYSSTNSVHIMPLEDYGLSSSPFNRRIHHPITTINFSNG